MIFTGRTSGIDEAIKVNEKIRAIGAALHITEGLLQMNEAVLGGLIQLGLDSPERAAIRVAKENITGQITQLTKALGDGREAYFRQLSAEVAKSVG